MPKVISLEKEDFKRRPDEVIMYTTKELANKTKIPKSTLIALRMQGEGQDFLKQARADQVRFYTIGAMLWFI